MMSQEGDTLGHVSPLKIVMREMVAHIQVMIATK